MKKYVQELTTVAFAATLVLTASPSSAQVYKWVDQNGKVQYTDTPPPPNESKADPQRLKLLSTGPATAPPAKAKKDPLKEALAAKEKAEAEAEKEKVAEIEVENTKIKAENCNAAQNQLKMLSSGIPLVTMNNGKPEGMGAAQLASEKARAEAIIKSSCQ